MGDAATWSDKEHEHTDITVALPVSNALALKEVLPRLLQALDEQHARGPEDREYHRAARAAVEVLVGRLRESLRPYDVPE